MKKDIIVTYEETLTQTVTLTVDDEKDIDEQARQAYLDEKIVLDSNDLQYAQFEIETPFSDWMTI
ncbi:MULTISPECIES: hypothetical protein [Weissella]|uniref:Uncharacterized protein n=1 Tax=Weissella thailandensis TaxID=89061 RepID=A0ABX9I6J4_9LACO|nr:MULTISPECIES: hypothetical protein [Weissella]MCT0485844.1 hypothetical protein [Weissella paramesenteroides]NKY90241.1 hypothetical protein [Weissella thailandensis]RDS60316.1 hypothetical protein DWV05_01850 [Weissella thailandensis]GEP74023.1 hypothetical protein WTH01_02700 [Weissella thailandensis]